MTISDCKIIQLPKIHDSRGNLTFVEQNRHIPFEVQRVYYLYDIPSGAERAGHAHYTLQQLLVAVSGSFEVAVDDGCNTKSVFLNNPAEGLLLTSLVWREIRKFSSGAVCLVLASDYFSESDYLRDYEAFLHTVHKIRKCDG